jgi:hypothetical protein
MDALHVGHAAARTGWSARMLRYLEQAGLVIPSRTEAGYRLYGLRELNQLRSLAELRSRFGLGIGDISLPRGCGASPASARRSTAGWPVSTTHPSWNGNNASTNDFSPHNERNRWQQLSATT